MRRHLKALGIVLGVFGAMILFVACAVLLVMSIVWLVMHPVHAAAFVVVATFVAFYVPAVDSTILL